jgi:RNA-directed DNA polymerase
MRRVYGMKVTRITLGGLSTCLELPASIGVGMGWQKSAEAIRVGVTSRQRAEHEVSGQEP